jgi:protein-tyrosine-phosphatase
MSDERLVMFVCPHGAGKSRIAAAWFTGLGVPGWVATSAGLAPQAEPSAHAPRLLAGTPVEALLDRERPRPVSAVSDPDLTVLIDCDESGRDGWGSVPHGGRVMRWQLAERRFDDAMCREIRTRVEQLAASLPARMDDGD